MQVRSWRFRGSNVCMSLLSKIIFLCPAHSVSSLPSSHLLNWWGPLNFWESEFSNINGDPFLGCPPWKCCYALENQVCTAGLMHLMWKSHKVSNAYKDRATEQIWSLLPESRLTSPSCCSCFLWHCSWARLLKRLCVFGDCRPYFESGFCQGGSVLLMCFFDNVVGRGDITCACKWWEFLYRWIP